MLDESVDIDPSFLEVAALLRAWTKDSNSVEVGTFDDYKRPTSSQVLTLIDVAVTDIESRLGPWLTDELADAARSAAALRTARLIELSYFPEQIDSRRSPDPESVALLDSSSRRCARPRGAGEHDGSRFRGSTSSRRHRCRSR